MHAFFKCRAIILILDLWPFFMKQKMIRVYERGVIENSCDLLATVDKQGVVVKVYDYNGNELQILFDEVRFNKKVWTLPKPPIRLR